MSELRVINQAGREMKMTREEFKRLTQMGINLHILNRELDEIVPTDHVVYTAAVDYKINRDGFGDEGIFKRSVMEAKRYKILPHLFFPDTEISIWTDANIYLKVEPDYLISKFLKDCDIAIFKHSYRKGVYDEFAELRKDPRFNDPWLQSQLARQEDRYKKEGLPNVQLYEGNFLIRRNNEAVNQAMEAWWAQITRWQWRDQVSLPYILWKRKLKIFEIKGNIRKHKFFKYIEQYK